MRRCFRIIAALVVLWLAWTVWPLVDFYRLARAVEERNAVALNLRIDYPELEASLSGQIVDAYLKLTGRDRVGGASALALPQGVRSALADPLVRKILNPEVLLDLLQAATLPAALEVEQAPPLVGALERVSWRDMARYYFEAEHMGRRYFIRVPLQAAAKERFGVRLRLIQWRWKLAGIDLPESLRIALATRLDKLIRDRTRSPG